MPYISNPTHRKTLNNNQLQVLYSLYKFRFGTTDLLRATQDKSISRQFMNRRLQVLCDQEYIGRKYDSSYKLQAKFIHKHVITR
jgi:DNA-binding HxlR family transcriptional regulator